MSRRPTKPWFRRQTGWWMATLGGRQVKLVKGQEHVGLAHDKFHELMLSVAQAPESHDARVADLCEAFLSWSQRSQSPETYRGYRFFIQSFCEACGNVSVAALRPFHVTQWIAGKAAKRSDDQTVMKDGAVRKRKRKGWHRTSQNNAVRSAKRVFSWATDEGYINRNPLHGLKPPRPERRKRYLTDDEFQGLLRHAGRPMRLFLIALDQTGARPCEVRKLTWDQVYADRWVQPVHKTVDKTGKPRVIYLTPAMQKMMRVLRSDGRSGHVFLNCHGKPWTRNALRLQIHRLKKKAGLAADVCAYLVRHRFGTRAIKNDVNPLVLAELMGHSSTEMISAVYVHLADEAAHLAAAVRKAVGSRNGSVRSTAETPRRGGAEK